MNNSINDELDFTRDYSLAEIFYIIKKRIKIISFSFLIIFFLCIYYTLSLDTIYKATGTIIISKEKNSMNMLNMNFDAERNFIDNEISILRSRTTAEMVIRRLVDLEESNKLYLFRKKEKSFIKKMFFNSNNEVQNSLVVNNNLIHNYTKKLRSSMSVSSDRNTDAINIIVESRNPDEAAMLVNTLIDIYKERDLKWATGEMNHLKNFLDIQIAKKEKELYFVEEQLKAFQKSEKIFGLDQSATILLDNLTKVETEYNNLLVSIKIIEQNEIFFDKQLSETQKSLADQLINNPNQSIENLKLKVIKKENELSTTISKYSDDHEAVKLLKNDLSLLHNEIKKEIKKMISYGIRPSNPLVFNQGLMDTLINIRAKKATFKSTANAYKKLVNEYENKLSNLPEKMIEYTRLERIRSIHSETYRFMREKLEEARIGEASQISKIRTIDIAIPNYNSVRPKNYRNIMLGSLLGLILGLGLAMLVEFFDNSIKSIEQIERRGLSILALIPLIGSNVIKRKGRKRYISKKTNVDKLQRRLITEEDPKSPVSEAYRGLRTSLMYTNLKNNSNIILVSSSGPGEGKTTTIANLAITYANVGKKTLLIDSDLRKPVMHKVFGLEKSVGLTSFLTNSKEKFEKIVNKTNIENLDIICSGVVPPNPSELLHSDRMKEFINLCKDKYDIILFDSPPLIAVTDAYVLLKYVDEFILVIRAGMTERGALERVLTSTKQAKFKITGAVLNAITKEYSYGAGYYYNYYQYYYGDSEQKN